MFVTAPIRSRFVATLLCVAIVIAGCGSDRADSSGGAGTASSNRDADGGGPARRSSDSQSGAERPVDAESLAYAEVGEELVYGYFAFPSDMIEPLPAIIMIHDWWGLNDDTRDAASGLAAEGYMVLAVDLYGGEIADSLESARGKMISVVENPDAVKSNLRQALDFVDVAGAPRKAVLGWGFGGGWSFSSTMLYPDKLDAAVIYYGQVNDDEDSLRVIEAPVLGFFGAKDRGIKLAAVRRFEKAMQRLRKNLTLQVYEGVGHAFADPARNNYNAEISQDAWRRTVEFLAVNLAATDES